MKLLATRVAGYLTNDVVASVPSFRARAAWYRALGLPIGTGSGVHRDCYLWFYGPGSLRRNGSCIGEHTRVNRGCTLDLRGRLVIGSHVSISPEVALITTQHDWRAPGFALQSRDVVVEDHVWIGLRATLLPGAHIGRGAVVAAGAVVSGRVEPLTVVAGIPARPVAQRPEAALDYRLDQPFPLLE